MENKDKKMGIDKFDENCLEVTNKTKPSIEKKSKVRNLVSNQVF